MQKSPSQSTCIHESSHAILSATFAEVRGVDVIATGVRLGVCRHTVPTNPIFHLAIAVSGPIGEWLFNGRRGDVFGTGAGNDLRHVDEILTRIHGRNVSRETAPEFKLAVKIALQVLSKHWGAVTHLASWLMENKTASGYLSHAVLTASQSGGYE